MCINTNLYHCILLHSYHLFILLWIYYIYYWTNMINNYLLPNLYLYILYIYVVQHQNNISKNKTNNSSYRRFFHLLFLILFYLLFLLIFNYNCKNSIFIKDCYFLWISLMPVLNLLLMSVFINLLPKILIKILQVKNDHQCDCMCHPILYYDNCCRVVSSFLIFRLRLHDFFIRNPCYHMPNNILKYSCLNKYHNII